MIDKKRIVYTAAVLSLSAALLAGCSGAESSSGAAAASAASADTPAQSKEAAAEVIDEAKDNDTIVIDYEDEESEEDNLNTISYDEVALSKAAANTDTDTNTESTEEEELTTTEEEVTPEANLSADTSFYYTEVPEAIKARMRGLSYPADDSAAQISWDKLRYMKVLYVNYSGITCEGELVCNKAIADDLIDIFRQLYAANYQICQIRLVDDFMANDDLSIAADNTSSFNYRVVEGTTRLSHHGLGRAIDINPLYNPCVYVKSGRVSPPAGAAYADRSADFPHKIDKNDLAYKLFIAHGFTWGGDWKTLKDYQHFEKK